ncbi:MAG: trypsin-like serine protease [Proteobacteria bacterium]|nr:trypsin-like serine protease [Pseudomonadota bacterium]
MLALLLALAPLAVAQDTGFDTGFVAPPIVGGNAAPAGKWDDTAGIVIGGYVGCTGTLVGPQTVLTAAHCLDGGVSHVVLGSINSWDQGQGEWIAVTSAIPHPDYRRFGHDIAVLRLASASSFTPRPISQDCTDGLAVNGATAQAVGFGSTQSDGGGQNSALMEVTVSVTDANCTETYGCDQNAPVGSEIVAGGNGFDSCNGDSGGPLYLQTEYGYVLIGVTSRPHYEGTVRCGDGGVYTRPDAFLDWIQSTSGGDVTAVPECNALPVVTVEPFDVVNKNGRDSTTFTVTDSDSTAFTTGLAAAPAHGTVQIKNDRKLIYKAEKGYIGPDSFVLSVADDHVPPGVTEVFIDVTVAETGCGCTTSPSPVAGWSLGLLGLLGIRRRRS